jgi:hypothetical protein
MNEHGTGRKLQGKRQFQLRRPVDSVAIHKANHSRPGADATFTHTPASLMIKRVVSSTGSGLAQLLGFEPCVNVPASHIAWSTSHHGPYPETTCVPLFRVHISACTFLRSCQWPSYAVLHHIASLTTAVPARCKIRWESGKTVF